MSEEILFPPTMGNLDTLLWYLEQDPVLRQTNAAITVLDRTPEREMLYTKLQSAVRSIPRLHQRVITLPRVVSTPIWAEDQNFFLDYHFRWIRAASGGFLHSVLELAASLVMKGFDSTRPLWEFIVVEDPAAGRAAVIQKLHHSVADAIAGILLMQKVYDFEPNTQIPDQRPPEEPKGGEDGMLRVTAEALLRSLSLPIRIARRGIAQLLDFATHPVETSRRTVRNLASFAHVFRPEFKPLSPIMRQRSANYSLEAFSVPVTSLKAAAHAADCKLNDAFLAAVAGGWRLYHEHHGVQTENLRAAVPLNVRKHDATTHAGTEVRPARIPVPVRESDPKKRMQKVHNLVSRERMHPANAYVETIAGMMTYIPSSLVPRLLGMIMKSNDFVAACVPGLSVPLYMAGARVDSFFTFGPPAGSAANITLFTYIDQAGVAITVDRASVPDHDVLFECMQEGFNEVLNVG